MAELTERLRQEGVGVTALDLPFALEDFTGLQRELCYWEAARILRMPRPVRPVPQLEALLAPYRDMDIARYLSARVRRQAYQAEFAALAAGCDAVLTPAATGAAPGVGDTGDAVMSRWSTAEGLPLGLQLLGGLRPDPAPAGTAPWFFYRPRSASRCSPR